jgi:hypothetical protein
MMAFDVGEYLYELGYEHKGFQRIIRSGDSSREARFPRNNRDRFMVLRDGYLS